MKNLKVNNNEYNLIKKLRNINKNGISKNKFNLLNEFEKQKKKFINPIHQYNKIVSNYNRNIRKTINENGKVYEVFYEDIGDGRGLIEKEKKLLGNINNINYRFSQMSNQSNSYGSQSYSKIVKTEIIKGKKYEVTYENIGDGNGMVATSRKLVNNVNNIAHNVNNISRYTSRSNINKLKNKFLQLYNKKISKKPKRFKKLKRSKKPKRFKRTNTKKKSKN